MESSLLYSYSVWTNVGLVLWFSFCAVFIFWRLGAGYLKGFDECLYAEAAREMVEAGDWWTIRFNFEPDRLGRSPLYIWLTALTFKAFGVREFTARFWSAAFGVMTLGATFLLGQELFGAWTGWVATLVLLTMPNFVFFSRGAQVDSGASCFIILALFFFWLGRSHPPYFVASGACIGLTILTKGFVGLLPGFFIALFLLLSREWTTFLDGWFLGGIGACALVSLPWHLLAYLIQGRRFIEHYVLYNFVQRSRKVITLQGGGPLYYLYVLKMGSENKWYLFSLVGVCWLLTETVRHGYQEGILLLAWIGGMMVALTAVKTKASWYSVPLYPALALAAAFCLNRLLGDTVGGLVVAGLWSATLLNFPKVRFPDPPQAIDSNPELAELAQRMEQVSAPDDPLIVYEKKGEGTAWPAGVFYSHRKVIPAGGGDNEWDRPLPLPDYFAKGGAVYCVLKEEDLPDLDGVSYRVVDRRGQFMLVTSAGSEPTG